MKKTTLLILVVVMLFSSLFASCAKETVYHTVTFDSDGGTNIENVYVARGEKITKPISPTKDGKLFDGWYADGEAWSFEDDTVTSDITLTAKWTDALNYAPSTVYYTVTFDTDGGVAVSPIQVEEGGKIPPTVSASRSGYVFKCWLKDGVEVNLSTYTVSADVTLVASWNEEHKCSYVNWKCNGCGDSKVLTLDEYLALETVEKTSYIDGFENKEIFIIWYREAYRFSGREGALSSKTGYMDGFDKTGFPSVILTWEEYDFCKDWQVQSAYRSTFGNGFQSFQRWFNEAHRIYEEEQNREEIGDGDIIDLG